MLLHFQTLIFKAIFINNCLWIIKAPYTYEVILPETSRIINLKMMM